MESDTTVRKTITATEIAEKFGLKGKIISFSVPAKGNSDVVSDKHLLFVLKTEGNDEKILSKGRIETDTKKSKTTTKNK